MGEDKLVESLVFADYVNKVFVGKGKANDFKRRKENEKNRD